MKEVTSFSKFSKKQKIDFLIKTFFNGSFDIRERIESFWHKSESFQRAFDEFSENTITNFFLPYGVVPNLMINNDLYCVPMVTEESSVVAASAKSAKFWMTRGGVKTKVISTAKVGQVHFFWYGQTPRLESFFKGLVPELKKCVAPLVHSMEKRGGGIKSIELVDKTSIEKGFFQIHVKFETCDAMGANFINSVLEAFATKLKESVEASTFFTSEERKIDVIMSILSNYTPECLVRSEVSCSIEDLDHLGLSMDPEVYADRLRKAVLIANSDVYRATTHNKGIMNGIDAVVLATGNDFRAVESCAHAYAARSGQYRSLSDVKIEDGTFTFSLELPLALGTVGGLTSLHPLAKISLEILGQPSAPKLMEIAASIGLAQNFGALNSLVTSGIQKGHMKMHLFNILNHFNTSEDEREKAKAFFVDKVVSHNAVKEFLNGLRKYH
ncbi:MAG: hydroxymethylglutaryl-CoA reductase [Bdellovibrionota bacterium]|nr:hydroxymethylglutaryl-CoA reductase [Bdellovibrionota bacterium]